MLTVFSGIGILVNRHLFSEKYDDHLPQKVAAPSPAWPMASVIKMNSTYLEVVDKPLIA